MSAWLTAGLSNAVLATVLALLACVVTRVSRHPHLAFAVWLLVLVKLLMPPLVGVPVKGLQAVLPLPARPIEGADTPPRALVISPIMPEPSFEIAADADVESELAAINAARRELIEANEPDDAAVEAESLPFIVPDFLRESWSEDELSARDVLAAATGNTAAAISELVSQLVPLAGWTWLAGSALWFAVALVRVVRFRRLLAHATSAGRVAR